MRWPTGRQTTCAVSGCAAGGPMKRGWCNMHYTRWRKYGDLMESMPPQRSGRRQSYCDVAGCAREHYGHGLCDLHHLRKKRGVPLEQPLQNLCNVTTHSGAHQRLYALWGRAADYPCVLCGDQAVEWAYDGTDPTQGYSASKGNGDGTAPYNWFSSWPEYYMPLCRGCHRARDGKIAAAELKDQAWKARHPGVTLADLDDLAALIDGQRHGHRLDVVA